MSIVPLLLACIFFKAIVGFSANLFALIVPSSLVMMSWLCFMTIFLLGLVFHSILLCQILFYRNHQLTPACFTKLVWLCTSHLRELNLMWECRSTCWEELLSWAICRSASSPARVAPPILHGGSCRAEEQYRKHELAVFTPGDTDTYSQGHVGRDQE